MEPPPAGLPAAADPERHCLRRLDFSEGSFHNGRISFRAEYVADTALGRQRFEVVVSADTDDEAHARALTRDFRAAFEAVEADPELLQTLEEPGVADVPEKRKAREREILIKMNLVDPAEREMVCGFTIDPTINADTPPHRYAPNSGTGFWVCMCISAGDATVRVFNGPNPTNLARRVKYSGCTDWLPAKVPTPRARVNGHADGTSYWIKGGWHQL